MSNEEVTEYWQHEATIQDHIILAPVLSDEEAWSQAGEWE